jgi:arylsulfatase A-like enzyme
MLKSTRTVPVALAVLIVAVAGWVVADKFVLDDPVTKTKVQLPTDPIDAGKDEPNGVRVYVDNSGPDISVSVRTPRKPWVESLDLDVNGLKIPMRRGGWRMGLSTAGDCEPTFAARRSSLLTRVNMQRTCFTDSSTVTAKAAADGGKAVTASAKQTERPNILMIMVDDMRTDELQWMPNVQKLIAKQGVTFTNGMAGFPLCCPARASVLTGQLPHNHGVWSHTPPWGFSSFVQDDTVPVWLQRDGYHTTYLGKYLNGYGDQPEPGKSSGTSTQYVPPGWDLWRGSIDGGLPPGHPDNGGTYRYRDTTLNDDGDGYVSLQGQYQTTAYARLTREQLKANAEQGKPFFSYVSFTAPHHGVPHEPDDPKDMTTPARPKRIRGAFDEHLTEGPGANWKDPDRSDKPNRMRKTFGKGMKKQILEAARQRAESLYIVDESVKKIIRGLKQNGQLDNTLVVFTSDNGYFLGEQGEPQGKILPYEPSLKVPVVVRGPGIPAGEVRTDPFLSIDFASTFADLADALPGTKVDGESLLDVARLGDDSPDDTYSRVVLTETAPTNAARKALAAAQPVGARQTEIMLGKITGIRTSRWLYTEWQPEPGARKPGILVELYDLRADPEEYVNLAVDGEHQALVDQFHRVLGEARTCVGADCRNQQLPRALR